MCFDEGVIFYNDDIHVCKIIHVSVDLKVQIPRAIGRVSIHRQESNSNNMLSQVIMTSSCHLLFLTQHYEWREFLLDIFVRWQM